MKESIKHVVLISLYSIEKHKLSALEQQGHDISYDILQHWDDPRLAWYKEDYGDIHTVLLKSASVWTPDVVLYSR